MSRSQPKPSPKQGPAATKDPEDPEVPSPRPSNGDGAGTTHTKGIMVVPTEPTPDVDDQKPAANGVTKERAPKKAKIDKRTNSTVDVSKEADADANVNGFWSFAGVMFGRVTRYMGSADRKQRLAGYSLAAFTLAAVVAVVAIAATTYILISIYGNKVVAFSLGGGVLTTGVIGTYLKHRRETADEDDED